jgi:hypothetical protein
MDGETDVLPEFFRARMRQQLGPMYGLLPEGALRHDHLAYLKAADSAVAAGSAVLPLRHGTPAPAQVQVIH